MNRLAHWIRLEHGQPKPAIRGHRADDRQGLRLVRHLLGALASLIVTCAVYVYAAAGLVAWHTAHAFAALVAASAVAFSVLIVTGLNRRFTDPSLTAAQMMASGVVISFLAYDAAALHPLLTPFYMVALLFGAFRFSTLRQLGMSAFFIALYCAAVGLSGGTAALAQELPLILHMALFLAAMSLIGGYVNNIRMRLRAANQDLTRALQEIERIATFDELTGLYNRRVIQQLAQRERKRADRSGASLCLAIVDADHFKRINDLYGHAAGDQALRALGRKLRCTVRETEYVGRYGGEEFLVVLPETTKDRAMVPLERLRSGTAAMAIEGLPAGEQLTVSIGLAEYRRGEDVLDTIRRADAALYEAKRGGRDRIATD